MIIFFWTLLICLIFILISIYKIFWKKKKLWIIPLIILSLFYIIVCSFLSYPMLAPLGDYTISKAIAGNIFITFSIICYPVILAFVSLILYGIYAFIKNKSKNFWKKYTLTFCIICVLLYLTYPFAIAWCPVGNIIQNNITSARQTPFKIFKGKYYSVAFMGLFQKFSMPMPGLINDKKDIDYCIESGEYICKNFSPVECDRLSTVYLITKNYDKIENIYQNLKYDDNILWHRQTKSDIKFNREIGYLIQKEYQKALDEIGDKSDNVSMDLKTTAYKGLKQYDKALEIWNEFLAKEKPSKEYYYCDAFEEKAGIYYDMKNKQQELNEFEKYKNCIKKDISYDEFKTHYNRFINIQKEKQQIIEDAIK